jgi:hypothetical protein
MFSKVIVDVEAIVLPNTNIVEQVAFVHLDPRNNELFSNKFIVIQQLGVSDICAKYSLSVPVVEKACNNYSRITGDGIIHQEGHRWCDVRAYMIELCCEPSVFTYAKGATLERKLFGRYFPVYELEEFNCPKYPYPIHDPLEECRFFARNVFIPYYATS